MMLIKMKYSTLLLIMNLKSEDFKLISKSKIISISLIILILIVSAIYLISKTDTKKFHKTSGALQALQNWTLKRAYPRNDIPSSAYFKAYLMQKRLMKSFPANYRWEEIGPHNIGGRTKDVKFNPQNPNTIFAASASGGLWRSFTSGIGTSAWERIETGYPVIGISSVEISPVDSNIIFIGTGEVYNYGNALGGEVIRTTRGSYGIGILKSTDYGKTWIKSLDWAYNEERGIQDLEIDNNNPNIIWAATTEGIYKSTNNGDSWQKLNPTLMAIDVEIHPTNSDIVFASFGNFRTPGFGIYRTTNGGQSWQKLTNGLPDDFGGKAHIAISKSNPNIIYLSIGNGFTSGAGTWLCKSTNGGDEWSIVNTTDYATYQGWYSHWVGVHPQNPNFVLTGGIDIWKSTDGGATISRKTDWAAWYFGDVPIGGPEGPSHYAHADHHSITFHPNNPNIIYFGTDGGVFRSTDGGETFEGCNGGYQTTQFYNGFSSAPNLVNLSIGGMQDNSTAIYKGTKAWYRVIGGDGCQTGINYNNPDIMYGTVQYLRIYRSTNRGLSFSFIGPSGLDNPAFAAPFVICPSNPNVIYACSRKIHKSINGGINWTTVNNNNQLDGNEILAIGVSSTSTDTLYVATAPISSRAKIFKSTNGGNSFINITGNLPDRYPDDIAVDPNDSKIVYIVFSGFGTSHLFKTTNGGESWLDIGTQLPDVPSSAIAINPSNSNQLFFGNDLGVYFSPDAGQNWFVINNGLPYACQVIDISIPKGTDLIRVVTHGNGVYQSSISQIVSNIEEEKIITYDFKLEQNFPNPFNSTTTIKFTSPISERHILKLYNIEGKELETIFDGFLSAGRNSVQLRMKNEYSSGIYFYQLKVGKYQATGKMVYLK